MESSKALPTLPPSLPAGWLVLAFLGRAPSMLASLPFFAYAKVSPALGTSLLLSTLPAHLLAYTFYHCFSQLPVSLAFWTWLPQRGFLWPPVNTSSPNLFLTLDSIFIPYDHQQNLQLYVYLCIYLVCPSSLPEYHQHAYKSLFILKYFFSTCYNRKCKPTKKWKNWRKDFHSIQIAFCCVIFITYLSIYHLSIPPSFIPLISWCISNWAEDIGTLHP